MRSNAEREREDSLTFVNDTFKSYRRIVSFWSKTPPQLRLSAAMASASQNDSYKNSSNLRITENKRLAMAAAAMKQRMTTRNSARVLSVV